MKLIEVVRIVDTIKSNNVYKFQLREVKGDITGKLHIGSNIIDFNRKRQNTILSENSFSNNRIIEHILLSYRLGLFPEKIIFNYLKNEVYENYTIIGNNIYCSCEELVNKCLKKYPEHDVYYKDLKMSNPKLIN